MTGVTEVETGSVGALVRAVLQVDDALARAQLLLAEVALVLVGWLGAQERTGPLGVQVALDARGEV